MPVTRAGVGYGATYVLGPTAAGALNVTVNVAAGQANSYGIAAVGWTGEVGVNTSTFDATWGGAAMVPLCDPIFANANKTFLRGWIIADPPAGATTVQATFSAIPFGLLTRNLFCAAGVFARVTPLDLDNIEAAVVTATGGSSGSSAVTVASGVPADRVVSVHLVGQGNSFTGFSGQVLASPWLPGGGQLGIGESRGEASTLATATHRSATANWAALGLNLDALPMTGLGFSSSISVPAGSFGADLYRFAVPHPDRDWMVPPVGSADPDLIGGATVQSASGVDMPVWVKDPDDTLDYTLRWNNHLAPDDEIIRVEHTAGGSLRVISEAINPGNPAMTQAWLKGATRGVTHPVRVRWWTRRGRQQDFTMFVAGENN